jgi:two-component system sensor histidine kinase KdpD
MTGELRLYRLSRLQQWLLSICLVIVVSFGFYISGGFFGYRIVSFGLLTTVAFLALVVDIYPVLVSALLSALIWNFFFIPPIFTFHIENSEDIFMFFSFFILASVHAALTQKIRRAQLRNRELQEQDKLLSFYNTFWNSLSHELKTPISTIMGSVDLLRNKELQISGVQREQLTFEIERACARLQNQVENLLAMNRLDAKIHFLRLDWYDVSELISTLLHREFDTEAQARINITLSDSSPLVKIDSMVFDLILKNLIQNALRYSPKQEKIQVLVQSNSDELFLSVKDKGIGIAAEQQQLVFNRFYRVSNSQTGGVGLGLSIVKGFVELHGGTVTLISEINSGTEFQIVIPCSTSFLKNLNHE